MKSTAYQYWLEDRTIPEPNSGCLIWLMGFNCDGYGRISKVYGETYAHRFVWVNERGPIPDDMFVLHDCDNPSCCNIGHLYLGSKLDNARDRVSRGREADHRGKYNGRVKLAPEQVIKIRAAKGSQQSIADHYGVSQNLISKIKLGQLWRHL